jgi:predicted metal-dependent hydrolase
VDGPDAAADLERVRDGLRLFNERYFFEAHEILEDLWHREHGEARLFLQGLIQICAGFHHFQNGNPRGAAELLQRGSDKMRKYPEQYMGLDAAGLLRDVDRCRGHIERMRDGVEPEGPIEFPTVPLSEPG